MKKIAITFLITVAALSAFAQTEVAGSGIRFETGSWAEILAKAKQQNKYVFVDAYTTWCGPCVWMEKNVFPSAEAGDFFNKNFINTKLDMEKGEGIDFAKKYDIKAFPTYLFVDGNGDMVHRFVGSKELPKFIQASSDALNPDKQFGALVRKFDNGERDSDFLYKAVTAAQTANDLQKGTAIAEAYLKTQTDLLEKKNMSIIIQFTTSTHDPYFEFMKNNAAAFEPLMDKEWKGYYDSKLYEIAYRTSFKEAGVKAEATKEEVAQSIKIAGQFFKEVLPEQATRLLNQFSFYVYEFTRDWDGYARYAIEHYDNNPSATGSDLNSIAWKFFKSVDNPQHLKKALAWAKQSVDLNAGYANTDTVANLYNKLGDKKNAKEYATKAIVLGKAAGEDVSSTEKLLREVSQ